MNFTFQFPHLRFRFPTVLLALFLCGVPPAALAQDAEVGASLSQPSAEVGELVEYQITVSGARAARLPRQIAVDGLDITYSGESTQVQMHNFNLTMNVTYTYTVVPQRTGRFVIPPQTIEAGGQRLVTNSVTLEVSTGGTAGGGRGGTGGSAGADAEGARSYYAELVLPKQTAFVGEAIPVELRIYVDNRIHWQHQNPPTVSGEGFALQKFTKPAQNEVTKDGRLYDLLTFRTAITPAKAGKLTLGPVSIETIAQLPRPRPRPRARQRPRGIFDDFFDDDLLNDRLFNLNPPQKLVISSEPVEIEVKPLPSAGQPKHFSGAVGQFEFHVEARPEKVRAGDPVTINARVSGRGNFDRAGAPRVAAEDGWRSYPPSVNFEADDDVGISGTKTFDFAAIPEAGENRLPLLEWSYFDPVKEKYVTLKGGGAPIEVEGRPPVATQQPTSPPVAGAGTGTGAGATAQPSPGADASPDAAPAARAAPATAVATSDILYIRTDEARWGASFEPLYRRRGFWLAQLVPLGVLLGLAGLHLQRTRRGDMRAQQHAQWRRERIELAGTLRRGGVSEGDFLDAAVRAIQLDAAMTTGREPATVDAGEACAARTLDARTAERVRALFAERAELRYAGAARGAREFPHDRREQILQTLESFEKAHATK